MTSIHTAARAAIIGLATGGRSTAGITGLALTAGRHDPSWLGSRAAQVLAGLAATGELVGDKLPTTPSRMQPGPLGGRVVIGGLAGGLIVRREGGPLALGVAIGAVTGFAGSWLGSRWRRFASTRISSDLPGALAEDVVVAGLVAAAVA